MKTLLDLYKSHTGKVSDKWALYLREYDRLFAPYREQAIAMLEIGIQNGGSLEIWSKYFPNAQKFVGCDINPDCAQLRYDDPRITVIVGDATTPETQATVLEQSATFDLIIEDGSHTSSEIVKAFARYFPALKTDGLFVAEDLHCSYWQEYEGGIFHPYSSITFFKHLADIVNHEHWGIEKSRTDLIAGFNQLLGIDFDEEVLSQISSIEFFNSICVVRKKEKIDNLLGLRLIAGVNSEVMPIILSLNNTKSEPASQMANEWSILANPPVETYKYLIHEIAMGKEIIARQRTALEQLRNAEQIKQAEAEQLRSKIQAKQAEAEQLRSDIQFKQAETEQLRNDVRAKQTEAEQLRSEIQAKQAEAEQLRSDVHAKQAETEQLLNEVQAKQAEIGNLSHFAAAIQGSRSWRYTTPLRQVGQLFRPAVRELRSIKNSARQNGDMETWRKLVAAWTVLLRLLRTKSPSFIVSRGLDVFRREGLRGITARLRKQHHMTAVNIVAANAPTELGFALTPAALIRDPQGRYALESVARGYTYVEPQRPADLAKRIEAITSSPHFSIVVPVYNTAPELLRAALSSVHRQWYPHWELILVDDASPSVETRTALAAIDHPQIRLLRLEKNEGIAGATNVGLSAAQGDFIVFMDHDDELTVDCLYELALCVEREQPDFIYSDEDKLDEHGNYVQPHFKPDWSPDTMMSTMFTCHVSAVRRKLSEQVGGLRSQYDGCQDWDFVLRVSENTNRISHVPKVLYHWRIIPASIAADIGAKPYVLEASRRVRVDALKRRGRDGSIEAVSLVPGFFRVNYHLRGNPLISIIIPSRDNGAVLERCIKSIHQKSSYRNFEIIVLDNGSVKPDTLSYLEHAGQAGQITVIRHDAPFNYSELNNIGAAQAKGDILLFLNDDTEVLVEDWLERMGGYAQQPHIGAVGAKLLYPGGKEIQHAGVLNLSDGPGHAFLRQTAESHGYFMRNLLEYNWLAVTGACLMIETEKYRALGLFDESFPIAYNDIELCFRSVAAGLFNVVCQSVTLIHYESLSRGVDHIDPAKLARLTEERRRLYAKHPAYFQNDPFHNPNLHPNGLNFEVPC